MQSIRTKPLSAGMKPCLECKEAGRRAYTEINQYWPVKDYQPGMPAQFMINHWCDTGEPDYQWGEGKRYCHGHGSLSGNIRVECQPTAEAAIATWNLMMTPIVGRPLSLLVRLRRRWFGGMKIVEQSSAAN